jgi:cyclase
LLLSGADGLVSINSAALDRPALIAELTGRFGSQCVVVAVDARLVDGGGR